jgi:dipeptidyl aminopeptidase/acylaminoacyl peptidase
VTYLTKGDPPLLIFHGSNDQLVPLGQSQHMHQRYQEAGLESTLHVLPGARHGGPQFSNATTYSQVKEFFARHVKQEASEGN